MIKQSSQEDRRLSIAFGFAVGLVSFAVFTYLALRWTLYFAIAGAVLVLSGYPLAWAISGKGARRLFSFSLLAAYACALVVLLLAGGPSGG
jgi:hypothetical protein